MIGIKELFDPESGFPHAAILVDSVYPWDPIKKIEDYCNSWINSNTAKSSNLEECSWVSVNTLDRDSGSEKILYIEKPVRLKYDFFLKELGVFIGAGTILEPTAILKPPAIIGADCEIRQGAYIRGNVIVGNNSVIGHTTEVKNSIFMNHSEAGHFAYIGDTIIGNHVNLGAGTKIANLQFRTMEEKKTGSIRKIYLKDESLVIDTGMSKLGAIIGDSAELGCNCVTCPCVILGKESKIFPTTMVLKGVYPCGSVLK